MRQKRKTTTPESRRGEMSVAGHLRELRNRLLICLGVLVIWMLIGMRYAPELVRLLLRMGERYQYQFVYISPEELLLVYFTVDFVAAFCLTLPALLYELWAFSRPGLKQGERMLMLAAMLSGTLFAVLGIVFAYRILAPFMLRFLISLRENSGVFASISVKNYISFLLTLFIIFAVIFELPVAAALLTQFHILNTETMKRVRKAVIPVIFLVAAVITPPDVVSQILVAVPLLFLYEFSILLCTLLEKIRQHKMAQEASEGEF